MTPLENLIRAVMDRAAEAPFPDGWRDDAHEIHAGPGLKAQRTWSAGYNAARAAILALPVADLAAELAPMMGDEVERLRGALRSVCEYEPDERDDPLMVIIRMAGIARAALNATKPEGEK